jgi:hypothetical protein
LHYAKPFFIGFLDFGVQMVYKIEELRTRKAPFAIPKNLDKTTENIPIPFHLFDVNFT